MADLTIMFAGLVLFTTPTSSPTYSTAVMVSHPTFNDVHDPTRLRIPAAGIAKVDQDDWSESKGDFKFNIDNGVTVEVGNGASVPAHDTSFSTGVPSVTAALEGAGKKPELSKCIVSGTLPCGSQRGFVRLRGGSLSVKETGDVTYRFMLETGTGSYESPMSAPVIWHGPTDKIVLRKGNKEPIVVLLKDAAVVEVSLDNPPHTEAGRHFGVYRHLWGMSNNGSQDGFPLPYSPSLLDRVRGIINSDKDDYAKVAAILEAVHSSARPIFCPPARQ